MEMPSVILYTFHTLPETVISGTPEFPDFAESTKNRGI